MWKQCNKGPFKNYIIPDGGGFKSLSKNNAASDLVVNKKHYALEYSSSCFYFTEKQEIL